jgi:ParB-like chromosome segregation protein Spo0J
MRGVGAVLQTNPQFVTSDQGSAASEVPGRVDIRDGDRPHPRPQPTMVALDALQLGLSPRKSGISDAHVRVLGQVLDRLPAILVHRSTMTVIDGAHRLEAFRRARRTEIPAILLNGARDDAFILGVQANISHGLPLSLLDRTRAAELILQSHPERSDRWIACICGLSHSTVAKRRDALECAARTTRVGLDGRRRTVPARAPRLESPPPEAAQTDRAQAPAAGELEAWLAATDIAEADWRRHVYEVPLGRVYELADECRRRSRAWAEVVAALEARALPRRNG